MTDKFIPDLPALYNQTSLTAEMLNQRYQNIVEAFNRLPAPATVGSYGFSEPLTVGEPTDHSHAVTKYWAETALSSSVQQANAAQAVASSAASAAGLYRDEAQQYAAAAAQSAADSDVVVTVTAAMESHVGEADPHTQYEKKSALGTAAYTESTAYATAAQGSKADTAIQPGGNNSALNNDSGFIRSDQAPVQSVDGQTGPVDLSASYEKKRKNNLTATTNPAATDDSSAGYEPLSRWINTATGEIWLCVSAASGAANWQQASLTLDELGSAAVADIGTGAGQVPVTGDYDPAGSAATAQAYAIQRENHTGTQPLSTISDVGTAAAADVGDFEARLAAIAAEKAVTAVDVFIYDTARMDTDGGAWRVNGELPSVSIISAEISTLTIYSADDPVIPIFATHDSTGYTITSIAAKNGKIVVGTTTGVIVLDYAAGDTAVAVDYSTSTTPAIVNNAVNDVAMTILPNAPVDPATGLQIPTIAVATDGGVSVIKDDGGVVDITYTAFVNNKSNHIAFTDQGGLGWFTRDGTVYYIEYSQIPESDTTSLPDTILLHRQTSIPSGLRVLPKANGEGFVSVGTLRALAGDPAGWSSEPDRSGLHLVDLYSASSTDNGRNLSIALVSSDFNTGWMHGDIKGAWLADTTAETISEPATVADRSVNANPLNVVGTLTKSPVATGSELVAYSGFSSTNYLEQPYNADLDFGTGDFYVMGWANFLNTTSLRRLIDRRVTDESSNWFTLSFNQLTPFFYTKGSTVALTTPTSGKPISPDVIHFYVGVRNSSGVYLYVDGELWTSASGSPEDVSSAGATLVLGTDNTAAHSLPHPSWMSLWRIGAGAPTADQIKAIYESEKVLFQDNAACTLYGSSDAVTALSHDPVTDLLHVGTSAGRSVFQGLRRVDNTTDPVGAAISAVNNLTVED